MTVHLPFHFGQTLLDAAALAPDNDDLPALILTGSSHPPTTVTRRDFRGETVRAAAGLLELGLQPGDLVIIAHGQTAAALFAFWGAVWLGAVPAMMPPLTEKLDPEIYFQSMARLSRFAEARIILATDELAAPLGAISPCPVVPISQLAQAKAQPGLPEGKSAAPEAIAFLQHSSGTTGLQKGVALSHGAVLRQIEAYAGSLPLLETDVIVSWLPLYHDMGLIAGFLLPLVAGIPLVLIDPFDWVSHPAVLLRAIHEYRGTLCWLPNFAYNHMARRIRQRDLDSLSMASMRGFINCSEPVRHESHELFLERFAPLGVSREMLGVSYAMAENTFAVTQTPLGQPPAVEWLDGRRLAAEKQAVPVPPGAPNAVAMVSCGPAIPGTDMAVVDEAHRPLPDRRVGEIAIRSSYLLTEYYHRPDLDPFVDGWYLTGDMGYQANGELYVIGRQKDIIINAGKNIYPQDIEAIVNTVNGIHPGRAVVFGVPDDREGTELIAVVAEVDSQDEAVRREIGRQVRQAIAQQTMVTATYVELVDPGWLVKTSSGKISRRANREKWRQSMGFYG